MLKRLFIKNLALIESLEIEWGEGFNVLTGETGAGKSITVEALLLILGEKASSNWIRDGESKGMVEASFVIHSQELRSFLSQQGLSPEGDELVIRREISSDGKSRAFVNDSQVNLSSLKSLGEKLVDLHGQHEHQSLLKPQSQKDFLDVFGDLLESREAVRKDYFTLQEVLKKKELLQASLSDRDKQLDFLKYQEKELQALNLQENEEQSLEEEGKFLKHSQEIRQRVGSIEENLGGEESSLTDPLTKLIADLRALGTFDETFLKEAQGIEELQYRLEDVRSLVRNKFHFLEDDPGRLNFIEERLLEIKRLKKKYGDNLKEVLIQVSEKLSSLEKGEEGLEALNQEIEKCQKSYQKKALALTKARKEAGVQLSRAVGKQLETLGLQSSIFEARVGGSLPGPTGQDEVLFYISTNKGMTPKPLHEIVSGGELSRIMLALKTLLHQKNFVPVLVFDEIDVNLGGETAHQVAAKLKEVSRHHQIIVITHLAQIAACSDHHYYVEKVVIGQKTVTKVRNLDEKGRTPEIARMLGGATEGALQHAQELLELAIRK
ncbi:MAG: DNA repair protein RecN [Chlamydiae bacterium]|nr:DNA repair protein RecN [Chlamydiota bacterium]MBI3266139.1 DNA repair protein RecN [Chlamydiota bacterium]